MQVELKDADDGMIARAIGFKQPAPGDAYSARIKRNKLIYVPARLLRRLGWHVGSAVELIDNGDSILVRLDPQIKQRTT